MVSAGLQKDHNFGMLIGTPFDVHSFGGKRRYTFGLVKTPQVVFDFLPNLKLPVPLKLEFNIGLAMAFPKSGKEYFLHKYYNRIITHLRKWSK